MQYEENKAPAERHHHRHGRAWPGHDEDSPDRGNKKAPVETGAW